MIETNFQKFGKLLKKYEDCPWMELNTSLAETTEPEELRLPITEIKQDPTFENRKPSDYTL